MGSALYMDGDYLYGLKGTKLALTFILRLCTFKVGFASLII